MNADRRKRGERVDEVASALEELNDALDEATLTLGGRGRMSVDLEVADRARELMDALAVDIAAVGAALTEMGARLEELRLRLEAPVVVELEAGSWYLTETRPATTWPYVRSVPVAGPYPTLADAVLATIEGIRVSNGYVVAIRLWDGAAWRTEP